MSAVPRLWWLALGLLLWTTEAHCRNYTHEDIHDAMLSIVHMLRMFEDKLVRHEFREKNLGEHVKRMLDGLDKKHRALEPVKGMISRLDERLSNVETILLVKEDREKNLQKKTNDALENIQKSLQALTSYMTGPGKNKNSEDNLTTSHESLKKRLETTDAKIDSVKKEIINFKTQFNKDNLRAICIEMSKDQSSKGGDDFLTKFTIANPLAKHLSDAEKLLNRYELKLNEYNETSFKAPIDVVQLNEVALADEAWHNRMSEEMERQGGDIKKMNRLLSDAESVWKDLPRRADLYRVSNTTLDTLRNISIAANAKTSESVQRVTNRIAEMGARLGGTNEDVQRSLTESNALAERLLADTTAHYKHIKSELTTLAKSEQVMLQTADNVIATKKRVEYAVQQIVMQMSELVLNYGKNINGTFTDKLNSIESTIMENQAMAQVNLSHKIEKEMSQVWRQIGIMHEQMKTTKDILDKFRNQTGKYVNMSTVTLGKVKNEVTVISERIVTLGDNFNYALGKLSLVTQEFSQISSGLADALTSLKKDIHAINAKEVEDSGPGPHQIDMDDTTP